MSGRLLTPLALTLALVLLAEAGMAAAGRGGRRGGRGDASPAVGAEAPDFELVTMKSFLAGKEEKVKLSSFRGKRDVVLVLSSYT